MCLSNMCKQANINAQSILGPFVVANYYYTNVSNLSWVDNTIFIIDQCNQNKIISINQSKCNHSIYNYMQLVICD